VAIFTNFDPWKEEMRSFSFLNNLNFISILNLNIWFAVEQGESGAGWIPGKHEIFVISKKYLHLC
jgi:hypothetical protein